MKHHKRNIHRKNIYSCNYCNLTFKRIYNLKRHEEVHRQNMQRQVVVMRDSSAFFKPGQSQSCQQEDVKVKDQTRKMNLANKMSRARKRAKEDEIATRVAFLEKENLRLMWEVSRLESSTGTLTAKLMADSENKNI